MADDGITEVPELSPTLLLDRYRVEGALGEGGLGTVVRAFDTRLKRTVAIKTLRRALAADTDTFRALEERFAREAEAGSRVGNHPNIVAVYDLVIGPDRTQYLILEYIAGGTLADRLRNGPMPVATALRLVVDGAKGLGAAHAVGIVHRDVKPGNLFVAADGRVQVGDFGIAQIDDLSGRTHTMMGHPGTPLYMAPEQSTGTGYMRPAADQYSLGLVLFEMLTGKAYKRLGVRDAATILGTFPPLVVPVVERMIAANPDDRYPDMDAVIAAIANANDGVDTAPQRSPAWDTAPTVLPGGFANTTVPLADITRAYDTSPLAPPHMPPGYAPNAIGPAPPPAAPLISPAPPVRRRALLLGIGGVIVAAGGLGGAAYAATHGAGIGGVGRVATATNTPGDTSAPLETPTTVRVALAGGTMVTGTTSAPMRALATPTPLAALAPTTDIATAQSSVPAGTAATTTMLPATMPTPAPLSSPRMSSPIASRAPMPSVTVSMRTPAPSSPMSTPASPTATPAPLLRPGPIVVPTAYPVVTNRVQQRLDDLPEGTSVEYTDIRTNTSAIANTDRVVPAAALIDIFIIAEAYRQIEQKTISLDTAVPIPKTVVGGTGLLQQRPGGTTTVREMITLIAAENDNLAANLLMDRVTMDNINQTIQVHGLTNTQLRRHLGDEVARKQGIDNVTTARDIALFLTLLVRGQVYTPFVSTSLINAMGQQTKPEWDYLGGGITPHLQFGTQFAHMTGQIPPDSGMPGVLHDAGIFYLGDNDAYVLVFLNQSNAPNSDTGIAAGKVSGDIYRIVTGK